MHGVCMGRAGDMSPPLAVTLPAALAALLEPILQCAASTNNEPGPKCAKLQPSKPAAGSMRHTRGEGHENAEEHKNWYPAVEPSPGTR